MELSASQYYIHTFYVPAYYYVYTSLEKWIATRIFREDTSRVFCASNDYAFRRRFELTDTSRDYHKVETSSLQFPFANYWPQNTGWEQDSRLAGNAASLIYLGVYEDYTNIRATGGIITIPTTFYFDREDDARLAYDKLMFYTYNEHVYSIEVPYGDYMLQLPVILEVRNLNFNPTFKETDWLKQNRIYTLTVNFTLRSYIIYPPRQPAYNAEVDPLNYDSGIKKYEPVKEVILNMQSYNKLTLEQVRASGAIEECRVSFNLLYIDEVATTSAVLIWDIDNPEDAVSMTLKIDDQEITVDPKLNRYQITGLEPDSTYQLYLQVLSVDGTVKRIGREFTTNADTSVETTVDKEIKNNLVNVEW